MKCKGLNQAAQAFHVKGACVRLLVILFTVMGLSALADLPAPVISRTDGNEYLFFQEETLIQITAEAPDAEIRYTIDGSEPTAASLFYEAPFTITSNTTVKAACFQDGKIVSDITSQQYLLCMRCDYFLYGILDGKITILDYEREPAGGNLVIPAELNGLPVTAIGDMAFAERTDISTVVLPESLEIIGIDAFYYCENLTQIILNEGLLEICPAAFHVCYNLKEITIPSSVVTIGEYAFSDCDSLTTVNLNEGLQEIGEETFNYCISLNSITMPSSLRRIGDGAFNECRSLSFVTLNDGLEEIGEWAFSWCESLSSITIPSSVTTIGYATFGGCYGLTSVTLNEGLETIAEEAFAECTELSSITIPSTVTTVGEQAFAGCQQVVFRGAPPAPCEDLGISQIYVYPELGWEDYESFGKAEIFFLRCAAPVISRADGIDSKFFKDDSCVQISADDPDAEIRYTLDGSNPTAESDLYTAPLAIVQNAFIRAACFKDGVVVSETATADYLARIASLGPVDFYSTIDGWSMSEDGDRIFHDAATPAGTTLYALVQWDGILNYSLSSDMDDPYSSANHISLTVDGIRENDIILLNRYNHGFSRAVTYTFQNEGLHVLAWTPLMDMTYYAIYDLMLCHASGDFLYTEEDGKLTIIGYTRELTDGKLVIPAELDGKPVTAIGDSAFEYTDNLYQVVLPETLQYIGKNAFAYCDDLEEISMNEGLLEIDDEAFCDCYYLISVIIPGSVTRIGKKAFNECESVTLNEGLQEIDEYAFYGTDLKLLTLPSTVTQMGDYAVNAHKLIVKGAPPTGCEKLNSSMIIYARPGLGWEDYVDSGFCGAEVKCGSLIYLNGELLDCRAEGDDVTVCPQCEGFKSWLGDGIQLTDEQKLAHELSFAMPANDVYLTIDCTLLYTPEDEFSYEIVDGEATIICCYSHRTDIAIPPVIGEEKAPVVAIENMAFEYCDAPRSVLIPESVRSISKDAFSECNAITAIHVARANATYCDVDGVLFSKDMSTLVCYPANKSGSSYTLPDTVTTIAAGALYEAYNLNEVILPEGLKTIGREAIDLSGDNSEIIIPASVEAIDCYSLSATSLVFLGAPPEYLCTDGHELSKCSSTIYALPGKGWEDFVEDGYGDVPVVIVYEDTPAIVRQDGSDSDEFTGELTLEIIGEAVTPGAVLRYTTDVDTPIEDGLEYNGPITLTDNYATFRAAFVAPDGTLLSRIAKATFYKYQTVEPFDNSGLDFVSCGDFFWHTADLEDGGKAAHASGNESDDWSTLETTVQGPGILTFSWRMNSYNGDLFLCIDNHYTTYCNSTDWQTVTYEITTPGSHFIYWEIYGSEGIFETWVDNVTWTPTSSVSAVLTPGWNVLAIPADIPATLPNIVDFQDLVLFSYDADNATFCQTSLPLQAGQVIWCYSCEPGSITLCNNVAIPETMTLPQLNDGWNAVAITGKQDVPLPEGYASAVWTWLNGHWIPVQSALKPNTPYFILK